MALAEDATRGWQAAHRVATRPTAESHQGNSLPLSSSSKSSSAARASSRSSLSSALFLPDDELPLEDMEDLVFGGVAVVLAAPWWQLLHLPLGSNRSIHT